MLASGSTEEDDEDEGDCVDDGIGNAGDIEDEIDTDAPDDAPDDDATALEEPTRAAEPPNTNPPDGVEVSVEPLCADTPNVKPDPAGASDPNEGAAEAEEGAPSTKPEAGNAPGKEKPELEIIDGAGAEASLPLSMDVPKPNAIPGPPVAPAPLLLAFCDACGAALLHATHFSTAQPFEI